MPDPYKTPEDMQDVYDEDAQKYGPTDKLIKEGKLKEAAEQHPDRQLLGSQLIDSIQGKIGEAGSAIMEAAQDDPDTWTDDAIRIGLGGVKNVGIVLGAPGIKQGLQLLGAPAYYVGRGLGYGLEKAGVDPRYGYIAGEVGEWFIPGYGMYKAAGKITKYSKIAGTAALSDAATLMAKQNLATASGTGVFPPGGELKNLVNNLKAAINPNPKDPFNLGPFMETKITPKQLEKFSAFSEELFENYNKFDDTQIDQTIFAIDPKSPNNYDRLRQKWTTKVLNPLLEKVAKNVFPNTRDYKKTFFNMMASKPGFKYIEHKKAKGQFWYWYHKYGDSWWEEANNIDNLRILMNDRFKTLKDVSETILYGIGDSRRPLTSGINRSIKDFNERYIIDIDAPKYGADLITKEHNAGDIAIRHVGSDKVIGKIGEYYDSLFSPNWKENKQLANYLKKKGEITEVSEEALKNWRLQFLHDKITNIINNPKTSEQAIQKAMQDDLIKFREEYTELMPMLPPQLRKELETNFKKGWPSGFVQDKPTYKLERGENLRSVDESIEIKELLELEKTKREGGKLDKYEKNRYKELIEKYREEQTEIKINRVWKPQPIFPTKRETIKGTTKGASGLPGGGG